MPASTPSAGDCVLCGQSDKLFPVEEPRLCAECYEKSETVFDEEMRRIEFIRTVRGLDVELYDVKHPDSTSEKKHCGQVILINAGQGFEIKICLRADALDWMAELRDPRTGFASGDNRLDALIGNIYLLIESWGGGPLYIDIFYVDKVVSTDGEV